MEIFIEILGYLGTALVIISMLMTSITRLRIINMCGGLVTLVYCIMIHSTPMLLMNAILIATNLVQLIRYYRARGNGDPNPK